MDGTPFGRYLLVELLGRGGMGEVWRAHDTATDRTVAVKLLPPHLAEDDEFVQRFRREAHAAAQLNSPHVIPIHNYGEIDGRLYVDMRLIEGRDLQTVLADGPLAPGRAVRIIEQVAKALQAAHRVGLVHRDVKPSNILLDEDDFAYLIDFGIARGIDQSRLTSTGSIIGSWHYMSPERLQAGQVDARADIYALACVLYECLTGCTPFPGDNFEQQITAHLTAPPPRPSSTDPNVPATFDPVIATGMAKDPDQRYATTIELANAAHNAITTPLALPSEPALLADPTRPAPEPVRQQPAEPTLSATQQRPPGWAPGLQPPPPEAMPTPTRPMWRRPRIVVPALLGIVVLIGGGVFAAVEVSQRHDNNPTATAPPNTGPFTGEFRADFGPETYVVGQPMDGGGPATSGTYNVRSVCRSTGCVATANAQGGPTLEPKLVFDDIGGTWVSVDTVSNPSAPLSPGFVKDCPPAIPNIGEIWEVISLQTRPDGTLFGEYSAVSSQACAAKRTLTFTRIGDVNLGSLPDPITQAPRVVSPAEALHGHYHGTKTYADGRANAEWDPVVRTDCLRTGERCMSNFYAPPDTGEPLVFGGGKWIWDQEYDAQCSKGTMHTKVIVEYPLPAPPQDPITLLTGHGHLEQTGACTASTEVDQKFVRTGD